MNDAEDLLHGEKLLWKGSPERGLHFERDQITRFVFGCVFFGFSLYWEYSVYQSQAGIFFLLWGIPFILIGAYMVLLRPLLEFIERSRTEYVLTNKRALIIIDMFGRGVLSTFLQSCPEVAITEGANGLATIIFGRDVTKGSGEDSYTSYAPRFKHIRDGSHVYRLIQNARADS